MVKERLLKYCGSLEQVASVRPITYEDGLAGNLRSVLVKNGLLEYVLMRDRCLDLASLSYKGINIGILTKPGLQGRCSFDAAGPDAPRTIMGGAMFTCGFDNIHGSRIVDNTVYPLHGRMRMLPMEKLCMDAHFRGEDYVLTVSGETRDACLFGRNIVLRRTVTSVYGSAVIHFRDEIENRAFSPEPLCFLYHINAGYPFLQAGCRVLIPHSACEPKDHHAAKLQGTQYIMDEPEPNATESVYLYTPLADENGDTMCAVINDELGLALCIRWNVRQMPYLTQWKSTAAGDYALGLEPTNTGFDGREDPFVQVLQPMQCHINAWSMEVVEGKEQIAALEEVIQALMVNN